jgi:hypothetical protein
MTSNFLLCCPLPDDDIALANKGSGFFWALLIEARIYYCV